MQMVSLGDSGEGENMQSVFKIIKSDYLIIIVKIGENVNLTGK